MQPVQSLDLILELDWTETFFRMLDLIVELIESPLDWIGGKIGLDFGFYRAMRECHNIHRGGSKKLCERHIWKALP